jgi:hypothetical protein
VAFEEMYSALVLFCFFPRFEGAEVTAFAGFGIYLSGVDSVLTGC